MLVDLEELEAQAAPIRSQVCIIGAGVAGHSLAQRLAAAGIDVALLEAGGRVPEERSQSIYNARMARLNHAGTHEGRFRLLGGSSTRWGGQLLPYTEEILQPSPSLPSHGWPLTMDEVGRFYPDAQRLLDADDLPFDAKLFLDAFHRKVPPLLDELPELRVRFSKCAPFSRRNLGTTVGKELEQSNSVTIYLHANLTELVLASRGDRIEAALVRNYAGTKFRFEAEHFVLAAGTIETSRLLLASRSVDPKGVGNTHDQVGRYFHDHINMPSAELTGAARRMFLGSFGPFLFRRTAHTAKFEASPLLRERLNLLAVMAHIIIDEPEASGVVVARSLLRSVQHRNMKESVLRELPKVPHALMDLGLLAYTAKFEKRRHVSPGAVVMLCLNSEQLPLADTRIRLDDKLDHLGMPKTVVDWTISDADLTTLRTFAAFLRERFSALSISGIEWRPEIFDESAEITGITDTFHPMGGCRMGTDPRESVVDSNLTVHGIPNLSIASAAVYPSGGSSNPSLTIIALALRLGDRLAGQFGMASRNSHPVR
ncbi:MAG TPA: GMC family oxidoreductase [Edaphobacter sp.]|jgi:choline dehydrogenase-like flavoprotein|nr:GMC family oxidoreductase [Edaphobacter sp.]